MAIKLQGDGASEALNRLAREQLRTKLLLDIQADMIVCELEGWDRLEWLHELHEELADRCPCERLKNG